MINMMATSLLYCLFIPVPLLAASCSDTGPSPLFVCIGNTVKVFENITSPSHVYQIILYKSFSGKEEAIATWYIQNVSVAHFHSRYNAKVSLKNGTIFIEDFQTSDQAIYVVIYDTRRDEMQLCAVDPPSKRCKAGIKQDEHLLIAYLDDPEYCGTPPASIYFMEYHGNVSTDKTVIELPPGTEVRKYIACIEGEALKCMKDSAKWNNCKHFTPRYIKGKESKETTILELSDIPQIKANGVVTIVIVLLVLLIVGVILYILRRQFGLVPKKSARDRTQIQMRNQELGSVENVPDGVERLVEETAA